MPKFRLPLSLTSIIFARTIVFDLPSIGHEDGSKGHFYIVYTELNILSHCQKTLSSKISVPWRHVDGPKIIAFAITTTISRGTLKLKIDIFVHFLSLLIPCNLL